MKYDLTEFGKQLYDFGVKTEIIVAMEMSGKYDDKEAYKEIKKLYKNLKKSFKKSDD